MRLRLHMATPWPSAKRRSAMAGVGQAYGADPVGAQAADTVTSTQKPSSQQVQTMRPVSS